MLRKRHTTAVIRRPLRHLKEACRIKGEDILKRANFYSCVYIQLGLKEQSSYYIFCSFPKNLKKEDTYKKPSIIPLQKQG